MMTRTAAAALSLLLALSSFAAIDVPVSDAVLGIAPGGQNAFDIGTDGDGFLVAWLDGRGLQQSLFAARISRTGEVLDPAGILLMRGLVGRPQVIWNGQRYLVFWAGGNDLFVSGVNRNGSASTAARRLLTGVTFNPYRGPSIETNGSRIVAIYGDDDGLFGYPKRLRAGVFTMEADLVNEHELDEVEPGNPYYLTRLQPSIAVRNSQFLLAWNTFPVDQQLELNAVRLSNVGFPIETVPHVIGEAGLETTIAVNGDGYVAVSRFSSWGVSADLTRITPPAQLNLFGNETVVAQRDGRAAVFGLGLGDESNVLAAAEFDEEGHVTGHRSLAVPSNGAMAAATAGDRIAVLWLDDHVVLSAMVDASTLQRVTEAVPLAHSATRQAGPAIAATSRDTLTAWQEDGGIRASRMLPDGTRLDGTGLVLSSGFDDGAPGVVFDGERYVVAFANDDEVVVRFVSSRDGLLSNAIHIPAENPGDVALANGTDAVLLVWKDRAVRISRSMQLIGTPIQLPDGGESPVAAWNGTEYLVAWRTVQLDFDYFYYRAIVGVRLNANLTLIDTQARVLGQVTDGTDRVIQHDDPALAWDGSHWLVAFTSQPWGEVLHPEVRVVRVGDGPLSGTVMGTGFSPELVVTPAQVWLAWKNDAVNQSVRLVTLDGAKSHFIAAPAPIDYQWTERIGLAARGEQVIFAYSRFSEAALGTIPRVFLGWTDAGVPAPRRRSVR